MAMKKPPHPGLSVRHDCLESLGLGVTEAAKWLGISRKQISDIANSHSGFSPEMAIRLDKVFGGGTETWCRIRAAHDFAHAMEHADEIKVTRVSWTNRGSARKIVSGLMSMPFVGAWDRSLARRIACGSMRKRSRAARLA